MNGLELARAYYDAYGRPMLETDFPETGRLIAAGLCGSGSECMGFDDEVSRDHDFEPGFCLFLPDEETVSRREAFLLERAYAKLPKEFMGFARARLSPVGGNRHGVIRLADFLAEKTGDPAGRMDLHAWMTVPEQNLLEVTDGAVWRDDSGMLTGVRETLRYLPEDIRLRKLSGELLLMNQSGQYNYGRCLAHGEKGAAALAAAEFIRAALHVFFLLEKRYMPYYKWSFRALRSCGGDTARDAALLETLALQRDPEETELLIAQIAGDTAERLSLQGLTDAICCDLEQHAYSVADRITDAQLRNMHILSGV